MGEATLLVVDDDPESLRALEAELLARYGRDYRVVGAGSPEAGLARLRELRDSGADVPVVLADQWMPGTTGVEFLGRVRELHPTARRGLLIAWGDRTSSAAILEAAALGSLDFYLPKPAWTPDEQFHRTIVEMLQEWWRGNAQRFEAVTVLAGQPSARAYELRDLLTRNNVPFGFLESASDEGVAALARLGLAGERRPVVAVFDGTVLVDPTNAEVGAALGVEVRPAELTYDVVIVGAGPAGLAAAVYGASEGLATAVLEEVAFGGQAGTSSLIRNYLGFPRGVSGVELAGRAFEQAWLFGAEIVYGNPAVGLRTDGDMRVLSLGDGSEVRTRTVVISTGVAYRRLEVPALEGLVGAGVFYGAGTIEAKALSGKPALVVGGGNSAGQAAVHLAKYASHVTVVVRSDSLAASMSDYLVREIDAAANVEVRYGAEVVGGGGTGRLERIDLRDRRTGDVATIDAAGLFVLIGASPHTDWLEGVVARDAWGYLLTGDAAGLPGDRPRPFLETSLPGVFAVGDVRAGSVKRVASAVGDGSVAIRLVHDHLSPPEASTR